METGHEHKTSCSFPLVRSRDNEPVFPSDPVSPDLAVRLIRSEVAVVVVQGMGRPMVRPCVSDHAGVD